LQKSDEQNKTKSGSAPELFERVKNPLGIEGHWKATLKDQYGNYKTHVEGKNVVTNSGIAFLAKFLHSAATSGSFTMNYIAIGTDSTAEAAGNSTLGTEASRHTGVISYAGAGVFTVVATFAAGSGTGDIVEYGVFSANTNGTMFNRATQSAVAKGASDSLEVTCNITLSNT
jgi:hypothetical protein